MRTENKVQRTGKQIPKISHKAQNAEKEVLLHICCAVCATACREQLDQEGYRVQGYFYNPNIYPLQEYLTRLAQVRALAQNSGLPLIIGDYQPADWTKQIKGTESQPEGGNRCVECFRLRLEQTKVTAQQLRIPLFTTSLTISPHKNAQVINGLGREIGGSNFLVRDFKKQDGFKRAQELAKKYSLYHQHYCGCVYSLGDKRD